MNPLHLIYIIPLCLLIGAVIMVLLGYYTLQECKKESIETYEDLVDRQEQLNSILKDVSKVLNDNDILYVPSFGTLLGMVKFGEIIPWDDDLDIFIQGKDVTPELLNQLHAIGFKTYKTKSIIDTYIYKFIITKVERNGYILDLFHCELKGSNIVLTKRSDLYMNIRDINFVEFKHSIVLPIPKRYEEYLYRTYGRDVFKVNVSSHIHTNSDIRWFIYKFFPRYFLCNSDGSPTRYI